MKLQQAPRITVTRHLAEPTPGVAWRTVEPFAPVSTDGSAIPSRYCTLYIVYICLSSAVCYIIHKHGSFGWYHINRFRLTIRAADVNAKATASATATGLASASVVRILVALAALTPTATSE